MKKRILSLFLCAALAASLASPALADAGDVPQREKAAVLRELEVMVGDQSGDLALDRTVTRAEFTKMLICASPYKSSVAESAGTDPYPDVSHRAWYAPHVRAAVDAGLVKGDLAGWFHPEAQITLAEGATMAVRLLGYTDNDFTAPWPGGQLALYRDQKLDAGLAAQNGSDLLTRQDCLHLFYNLLCASTKQGTPYITSLGYALNQQGEVDINVLFRSDREGPIPLTGSWASLLPFDPAQALIFRNNDRAELSELREWDLLYWCKDQPILFASSDAQSSMGQISAALDGPVVAEGDWQSKLPFSLSEATSVTRNGAAATADDIAPMDVVYWSKYAKSLSVWANSVWGTVDAVTPSPAAPTAVTVAGATYPLETFEAQYAFSDLGSYRKGDTVKLLLGRGGGVAAVRALSDADRDSQVGLVTALTSQSYTDAAGKPYASKAVTILASDGQGHTYPYPWRDKELELGDLVELQSVGDQVKVTRLSPRTLSGTVNAEGTRLGQMTISPEAEILDTYGDYTAATVSPARLAGIRFSGSMVRYYATDAQGAVTTLILNNVTGDLHRYGVLTDKEVVNVPGVLQGVYTFDIQGRTQTLPSSGKVFPVEEGPFCLMMDGSEVKSMRSLTQLRNVTLGDRSVQSGSTSYPLADDVAYYRYDDVEDTYTLVTRAQLQSGGGTLSAWYDTPPAQGGRVRVVLAQ